LYVNWLITGSVGNGKFKISFVPMDGKENPDMDLKKEVEFDPGASAFYAELLDGWVPGPRPRSASWVAPGQITDLSFNADEKLAVSSNSEQEPRITVMDPRARISLDQITPAASRINDIFYEGTDLLAGLSDRIEIYDENLSAKLAIPVTGDDEPYSVVSAASKILVSGKYGGIFVYDQRTGEPVTLPQPFNTRGQATRAAVSPDKTLFGICAGNTAWIFPATTLRLKQTITGIRPFHGITFGDDNRVCLATEFGAEEYMNGTLSRTIAEDERTNAVGYSANGILVLLGGEKLRLYKSGNGTLVYTLYDGRATGTGEEISLLTYSPAHTAAAHGSSLEIWDSVAEPGALVTVINESSYTASFIFDTDASTDIAPNACRQYRVIILDTQKKVTMRVDEKGDSILLSSSFTLRPGEDRTVRIRDNTNPKVTLAKENKLEVAALAASKNAIIAAYPTLIRGKSSIASAEVVYLNLNTGQPTFLRPHLGKVTGIASNENYIISAGADGKANVYTSSGEFQFSITLESIPIGADIDDANRLLVIYEDGVSIINNLTGFNVAEKPPKAESTVWENQELTAAVWKLSLKNTAVPLEAALPNGKTVTASDYLSFKDGAREIAAFALFSTLECALITYQGRYTGSALAGNHLLVTAGPKTTREFEIRDINLYDPDRVKAVLSEYIKQIRNK
jgi:WD40 repeat protein